MAITQRARRDESRPSHIEARTFDDLRGVALVRVDAAKPLYRGMKERFGYVVTHRGGAAYLCRGRTYETGAATLGLKHPAELIRQLRRDPSAIYDVVLLDLEIFAAARAALGSRELAFPSPLLDRADPRARPLLRLHASLVRGGASALARETAVTEAVTALALLAAPRTEIRGAESAAVGKARAYLLERLAEHVCLDDLADHVGLDKYHLVRAFRAQLGAPPYEYLTHARISRACELLRAGRTPARAASELGYYDQSQLHRHFRRLLGVTPGEYARRVR